MEEDPTSIMIRLPYVKGVTHSVDYTKFLSERGVDYIEDIFGDKHSVYDEMMIITESMYKGLKYFGDNKDGWNNYWRAFDEYNHCMVIAKWNKSAENENIFTRTNYQVLQTLDLEYDDFIKLADKTIEWVFDIVSGDLFKTYAFLGLLADEKHLTIDEVIDLYEKNIEEYNSYILWSRGDEFKYTIDNNNPVNEYAKALLLNNEMRFDPHIQKYLINTIRKKINDMKIGKLYVEGEFKILSGDIIMFMEWIGNLDIVGVIEKGEFYANKNNNSMIGQHAIFRNPHISASENVVRNGINNDLMNEYCGHLDNVIQISNYDITTALLSGADFDGDLVFVTNEELMIKGSPYVTPIVNLEDKATAISKVINSDSIIESVILGFGQNIGKLSNISTTYLNKFVRNDKVKQRYNDYIDFISVVNGVEIDSAKTGYKIPVPKYISDGAKQKPFFMKFKYKYLKSEDIFMSNSNMNRLAKDISKWEASIEKYIKDKNSNHKFNYHIMIKDDFAPDIETLDNIKKIYLEFNKDMKICHEERIKINNYNKYKNYWKNLGFSKEEVELMRVDEGEYHNLYRERLLNIIPDIQDLASYLVYVVYKYHPNKSKKFAWAIASDGILKNLNKEDIYLPVKDNKNGNLEYLGEKYRLELVKKC
jgi:hypothetical protein